MNISDKIADSYVEYAVNLNRYSASVERDVRNFLHLLELDLVAKLATFAIRLPEPGTRREVQLRRLLEEVQASIGETFTGVKTYMNGEMLELASIEALASKSIINGAVGVSLVATGLSKELLAAAASDVLILGAPSKEWWSRQEAKVMNNFKDQVRFGLVQGESISDIVRRVRGTSTGRRIGYKLASGKQRYKTLFAGGILDVATRDAKNLVVTSIKAVSESARFALYNENKDVIKGLQALATLDARTSVICQARSGHSWSLEGVPLKGTVEPYPGHPPWHFNCRSTFIPILYEFHELAGNVSASERRRLKRGVSESTQASMDGQVAESLNYSQWLKTKDVAFQRSVLGPTKLRLWKSGRLPFRDMIDQSGNPIKISVLKEMYK